VHQAATNAFINGLTASCFVAGSVAAVGVVIAIVFLPPQPPTAMFGGAGMEPFAIDDAELAVGV
jgi:hypothetical protein